MAKLFIDDHSSICKVALRDCTTGPSVTRRNQWASSSKGSTPEDIEHEEDKPVVYSTSKAAQWKAQHSFRPIMDHDPPALQRYSVILSTAAFLIYFCILREENDLDEILDRPLSATVPDIEKIIAKPPEPPENKKSGFF
ncbi:uncharacterized protein LOC115311085 isoform X2 [Ixodes scapularis]|uniref:uncharacterized protein LOC115311085 isoform X2 n=1 Tax=Ixodes scapularis TaxID=6945 RepID=UPI001C37FC29|nr:uncharacterized protein LOC115311085 isoform X2 [Ixodes scapularis]